MGLLAVRSLGSRSLARAVAQSASQPCRVEYAAAAKCGITRRLDETKPLSPFQTIRQTLIDYGGGETRSALIKSGKRVHWPTSPAPGNSEPDMWWIVHIEGGPRRVNHAAVAVGEFTGQEDLGFV